MIPWLQRLPSGVGRLDQVHPAVEWWSWELLAAAVEMLGSILSLTENRGSSLHNTDGGEDGKEDGEEDGEEGEESLNVHRMRLSSLAHACVHLFRKTIQTFHRSRLSKHDSFSLLSSLLWRIYTASHSVHAEYAAVAQEKSEQHKKVGGEDEKTEGGELFDHPAVYLGLDVNIVQFMLQHHCEHAVDLMTTLRCPTSARHALHQFITTTTTTTATATGNNNSESSIYLEWKSAVVACLGCLEQQANDMYQQRTHYVYTANRVTLHRLNTLKSMMVPISPAALLLPTAVDGTVPKWSSTVKRFLKWCTFSKNTSDILCAILQSLPTKYGPMASLYQASMRLGDEQATRLIRSSGGFEEVGKVETPAKKKKSKKKSKSKKQQKIK